MKQAQYSPLTNAEIVCVIYAGTQGFLDNLPVGDVGRFEAGLLNHMRTNASDVLSMITKDDPKIKGDAEDKLKAAIDAFAADFS